MNGVWWKPKVDFCLVCPFYPSLFAATFGEPRFALEARKDFEDIDGNRIHQTFWIYANDIQANNVPKNWRAKYTDFFDYNCGHYVLDTTYQHNRLDILRFDGIYRGILKGAFEFRLVGYKATCPDTLLVTKGYFDFQTDV